MQKQMEAQHISWHKLPQHILVSILGYLTINERFHAALVCKTWYTCLQDPLLWRHFVARFVAPINEKVLVPIAQYGHRIRALEIEVDQSQKENRLNACKALNALAENQERKLSSLTVRFTGQNPLFYAGVEFITELKHLFGCFGDGNEPFSQLTNLDLSGLDVAFDNSLFDILSNNHPCLQSLNIQNKSLICKVTPGCLLQLVSNCRKLRDLRVFHVSLDDLVLTEMAQQEHPCLRHLSILFRRETKYTEDLSSESWFLLASKIPKLSVTLIFDHTCPLHRVCEVMKPEIPVTVLRLETFTHIHEQVNHATTCYNKTLEKLVLQTRNSEELEKSLLHLAATCEKLNSLLVYCVLPENIIQQIFQLRPEIQGTGNYILKSRLEEGPWVVGVETEPEYEEKVAPH